MVTASKCAAIEFMEFFSFEPQYNPTGIDPGQNDFFKPAHVGSIHLSSFFNHNDIFWSCQVMKFI